MLANQTKQGTIFTFTLKVNTGLLTVTLML